MGGRKERRGPGKAPDTSSPAGATRWWLVKSEPDVYSIDDLARDGQTPWTGVRNYQARNFMRDGMRVGDRVFVYHSNAEPSGIAGLAEVCSVPYPDPTQFDPRSPYHEPRATTAMPVWVLVDIRFLAKLPQLIPLEALRTDEELAGLALLQRGSRLSVMPVDSRHAARILARAGLS